MSLWLSSKHIQLIPKCKFYWMRYVFSEDLEVDWTNWLRHRNIDLLIWRREFSHLGNQSYRSSDSNSLYSLQNSIVNILTHNSEAIPQIPPKKTSRYRRHIFNRKSEEAFSSNSWKIWYWIFKKIIKSNRCFCWIFFSNDSISWHEKSIKWSDFPKILAAT